MNGGLSLAVLFARRLLTPGAALLVISCAAVAPDPRTAWSLSMAIIALLAMLRAAAWPDEWLTGEGDWLGTAALPRVGLTASCWAGAAVGTLSLTAIAGATIAARSPWNGTGDHELLEAAQIAGPERSFVLMPGETFDQPLSFPGAAGTSAVDAQREVRVRSTVTLGGETPTTFALIEAASSGGPSGERGTQATAKRIAVARRTWLILPLAPTASSIRITNVGEGALAILGPDPVEVWTASGAWVHGHVRMWGHASAWLLTLVSLALLFGVVMGPGIAALLAGCVWLFAWMSLGGTGGLAPDWLPGGPALRRGLEAVHRNQSPLAPPPGAVAIAGLAVALGAAAGASLLRTWRDEVRG